MDKSWQVRVRQEASELDEKLEKLKAFLNHLTASESVDANALALLQKQEQAMTLYLDILNQRISSF